MSLPAVQDGQGRLHEASCVHNNRPEPNLEPETFELLDSSSHAVDINRYTAVAV